MQECWLNLGNYYDVEIDEFILMPNHLHGIVVIENQYNKNIGDIVKGFKTFTNKHISQYEFRKNKLWQRNYYEHIIRNEKSLHKIREYILMNPYKWNVDEYNV